MAAEYLPVDTVARQPLVPSIGPPRNVRIGGMPASGSTGGGLTPTITWDPPSIGVAALYTVSVSQLMEAGGDWTERVSVSTQTRSVTIPPGLIQPGQLYELWLSAATRYDPKHPYQDALPDAHSATVVVVTSP